MDRERCFVIGMFIVLLSHEVQAMNSVWKTTTSFDSEKSRAILSWSFNTTEAVTSVTIRKGKEVIASSLLTSDITVSDKYQVVKTQTTREIKITLTVYNITSADYGVYRCSLDQLDVHKDIHLTITVWVDPSSKVTARSGEDATFTWQYKYSFQPSYIIFRRRPEISASKVEPIIRWSDTKLVTYPKYKGMARMKKTAAEEGEIIQLSLLNTSKEMFGSIFECQIVFKDRQLFSSEIKLMGDADLTRITTEFTDIELTGITTEFTDIELTGITTEFTDIELTAITTYHPVIMTTISVWIHSNYHVILIPPAILFIVLLFYLITRFFMHWRKHTPTYYQQLEGYVPNVENSYTAIRRLSTVSSIDTHLYDSYEEIIASNVDNGTLISSSCTSNSSDYEFPIENTIEEDINPRILGLHNHSSSDRCAHRETSYFDDNESLSCSSVSDEYEYPTENQNQHSFKSPIISSHESGILLDKHMETGSSDSISSSELFEYPPSKQFETVEKSESMVTYYDIKLTSSYKQESEL